MKTTFGVFKVGLSPKKSFLLIVPHTQLFNIVETLTYTPRPPIIDHSLVVVKETYIIQRSYKPCLARSTQDRVIVSGEFWQRM